MARNVKKYGTNVARGSMARAAVEAANAALLYALSRVQDAAGAAGATTAAKVKTANTIHYSVLGKLFSKSATDNFWTLSGAVVPASSFQKYALLIDTAGAASVQEATASPVDAASVDWSNVANLGHASAFQAMVGTTKAVVAVITVATDSTHTFTPGTTALNATGITTTYVDGIDDSLLPAIANEQGTVVGLGG